MRIDKNRDSIKVSNIREYVANKAVRNEALSIFTSAGEGYYSHKGERLTIKEFHTLFPVQLNPFLSKGKNCDRRKNWAFGEKSY